MTKVWLIRRFKDDLALSEAMNSFEDYDSPGHPNEIHLATHDVTEAIRQYNTVKNQRCGFGYAIYKIPMDEPSTIHSGPNSKTTWLSDCKIISER